MAVSPPDDTPTEGLPSIAPEQMDESSVSTKDAAISSCTTSSRSHIPPAQDLSNSDNFDLEVLGAMEDSARVLDFTPEPRSSSTSSHSSGMGSADDLRDCPFCGEAVKRTAIRCKHCKSDLSRPSRARTILRFLFPPKGSTIYQVEMLLVFVVLVLYINYFVLSEPFFRIRLFESKTPTGITWSQFQKDCGRISTTSEETYSKSYAEKCIRWSGFVESVEQDSLTLRMMPLCRDNADLKLSTARVKNMPAIAKGDSITFTGHIRGQGAGFFDNTPSVEAFIVTKGRDDEAQARAALPAEIDRYHKTCYERKWNEAIQLDIGDSVVVNLETRSFPWRYVFETAESCREHFNATVRYLIKHKTIERGVAQGDFPPVGLRVDQKNRISATYLGLVESSSCGIAKVEVATVSSPDDNLYPGKVLYVQVEYLQKEIKSQLEKSPVEKRGRSKKKKEVEFTTETKTRNAKSPKNSSQDIDSFPVLVSRKEKKVKQALNNNRLSECNFVIEYNDDVSKEDRVEGFDVPKGMRLVIFDAERQKNLSMYDNALDFNGLLQQVTLETDKGEIYFAQGFYAVARVDGKPWVEIQYHPNPDIPERCVTKPKKVTNAALQLTPKDVRRFGYIFVVHPDSKFTNFKSGPRAHSQPVDIGR